MNLRHIILSSSLCLGLCAQAQTLTFSVSLPDTTDCSQMRVFVRPLSETVDNTTGLTLAEGSCLFSGEVQTNPYGIYYIYTASATSQASIPVYVTPGKTRADVAVGVKGYYPTTDFTDAGNRAIEAFNNAVIDKSVYLGNNARELTPEQFATLFRSYRAEADSIITADKPTADVAAFIRLTAYTCASDAYSLAQYLNRRSGHGLGITTAEFLADPSEALDTPMASAFSSAASIVAKGIHGESVEDKLDNLYATYKTQALRDRAADMLVKNFVDSFNYRENFDAGEKRLEAMTAKYGLSDKYLTSFRSRRATIPDTPFPDVRLLDRDGNPVEFSSFAGKYVYIDFWASWCVPCCKEVPFLQKLEKELEGGNITFVSISIDSDRNNWLKKMTQLDMHGNQLIDADGQLASKLNIRGIPHFMLYGPDGKLVSYSMTRPSDPATLTTLSQYK